MATPARSTTRVDVSHLTRFPWDRFYVFSPYTGKSTRDEALGFNWGGKAFDLELRDDIVLFVFAKGKHVVAVAPYSGMVDFRAGAKPRNRPRRAGNSWIVFQRDDSIFSVRYQAGIARLTPV